MPEGWRGALPITYHIGPRPGHGAPEGGVRLERCDRLQRHRPLRVELPDEWIVRGNHHDAWVNGAEDPVAG